MLLNQACKLFYCFKFQRRPDTWIYDTVEKSWTQGPNMISNRLLPSCMVDHETGMIHVMGGHSSGQSLASTETLKIGEGKWKVGSNLPMPLDLSAAASSRYSEYVGYLAGGYNRQSSSIQDVILGLRRSNMTWVELSNKLQTSRAGHSLVNIRFDKLPGC